MQDNLFAYRGLAAIALAAAIAGNVVSARLAPPPTALDPGLWLHSPDAARRMALSFKDVVADAYWVRAVVHYGGERLSSAPQKGYPLLYPFLDFATTLDRHLEVAYSLGAIFLSEGYPGGPGRPDLALQLLEKGRAQTPTRWQYDHDIAFVHYWWLKDFKTAAAHFERASRLPGAPAWLKTMAALTLTKGGDRASARQLWNALLTDSDVDWIKRSANYRLQQLQALDDLDALTAAVDTFTSRTGRVAATWNQLGALGLLRATPADPTGAPYVLDAAGRPALAPDSPLHPLPGLEAAR